MRKITYSTLYCHSSTSATPINSLYSQQHMVSTMTEVQRTGTSFVRSSSVTTGTSTRRTVVQNDSLEDQSNK